jgi:N-acetylglucosamine-6-phosphate deacetylase
MKCNGLDAITGNHLEISFSEVIDGVDHRMDAAADDVFLAPGFIDLQVNGFFGVDYNSPEAPHDEIARSLRVCFATGVTRFFPTVITGSPENMQGALRNLADARERLADGAAMEAFHVEGPFISPEDGPRGAHPREWVRPPDVDEFQRMQEAARGLIRLITVSPEWPDAPRFIETVVRQGVAVSIGHTKAAAEQISAAVSAGATLSTHLGNGAHAVLSRHPNYIWEQLAEDRLAASFIVDGIHLGRAFLTAALRAKGAERAILVTDAVAPAGCAPGPYMLGGVAVQMHPDGSVRLRDGDRLAGSTLMMDRAIVNVMKLAGVSLREAITMATRNSARVGRIPSRMRGLATGERADLVRFRIEPTGELRVLETWMSGRQVFAA